MSLADFKSACRSGKPDEVVQRFLVDGAAYFFEDAGEEFAFKKSISSALGVHIRDLAIVGSGKLGFSLKPDKKNPGFYEYKKFDSDRKSDLDVAVVSGYLFDSQLKKIYEFTDAYSSRIKNYPYVVKQILKGRLRPSSLPEGYLVADEIEEAKSNLEEVFDREVNFEIYKSWFYFEKYHINNVNRIILNIVAS